MLEILKRGTVQVGSLVWEYHGDSADNTIFYITPQPVWATTGGLPEIQLVQYETSGTDNGCGYATIQVQLGVSDDAIQAVTADIAQRFQVQNPRFLTLQFQTGTVVSITYPDGEGGTTGLQVNGTDFGSNSAIFQLPLSADQMTNIKAALAKQGGSPFEIQYSIIVPTTMPAVTVELSFDSSIAFNYQVTSHEHTHWASKSSYTYDITQQLTQNSGSKIKVDKVDPNISQDVVQRLTEWGQAIINQQVADEVAAALALQQNAGGTQSFSVNEVASFTETYEQDETILWRLQPVTTLPSFGDLGLSPSQIESLEVTVDKRQFVAQVTPACNFKQSQKSPNPSITPSDNPFLTNVEPLDHIDVTITYPTLTSSQSKTHTFTDNTPYTWQADWDDTAGGVYSLSYVAVYTNGQQVTGQVNNIDASVYTLGLDSIGTLNVTFDASRFFAQKNNVVDQVTIDFVFNIPQEPPFLQSAVLKSTDPAPQSTVFHNIFAAPITTDYLYTVTYGFAPTTKADPYTSDVKTQNGQWVRLEEPDFQQSFNINAEITDKDGTTVQQADVNIYYEGTPYFPNIPDSASLPSPSSSSPIQLNFPKSTENGLGADPQTTFQTQPVWLFANSQLSPLTINATILTSDFNQIQIGPYNFSPQTVASIAFGPSHQFAFIDVQPTIVDWTKDSLANVQVFITAVRYQTSSSGNSSTVTTHSSTASPRPIAKDVTTGQPNNAYFVLLNLPLDFSSSTTEFDWYAQYTYKSGVLYAHGTEQGVSLTLPPTGTEAAPPKS